MKKYLYSEWLKHKKSFVLKLLIIMPVVTVLLAVLMMAGNYVQMLAYNWWYLLFLPFVVSYTSAQIIRRDEKKNFHGLFGVMEEKKNLILGKTAVCTLYLGITNVVFGIYVGVVGLLFGKQITMPHNLMAVIILMLTLVWQIPFSFLLALKCNAVFAVMINVVCNIFFACAFAEGSLWWIPFAVPARMMCITLGILPNGLLAEDVSIFGGYMTVASGIGVSVLLYVIFSVWCGKVFTKHEV